MATSKVTAFSQAAQPAPPGRTVEAALIERARRGDLGAFEEIYRAHSGKIHGLLLRMVGNPADSEDLLQEVFLAAHRKLEGFRGDSALGTWLYRLATNHCLDYLRSRANRTGQLTDALDDDVGLPDTGTRGIAAQAVDKIDLERAVAQLPEGCRAAFLLHDVEGLEHREVADALGIAEGTSKSQVHKARLKLRALLSARK